jgi:hypothetical protein
MWANYSLNKHLLNSIRSTPHEIIRSNWHAYILNVNHMHWENTFKQRNICEK